jgi:hypothetical protein
MNNIAKLPAVAAAIYRHTFKDGRVAAINPDLDWSANFSNMLGFQDEGFAEMMRLYLSIHADHEGGNVSAHTVHLVGSALSDPYLCFAAGMNGLAGPLHGLANQEVLVFLMRMIKVVGTNPSDEAVKDFVLKLLASKQVVPGYGHAVLRIPDPRFVVQQDYAMRVSTVGWGRWRPVFCGLFYCPLAHYYHGILILISLVLFSLPITRKCPTMTLTNWCSKSSALSRPSFWRKAKPRTPGPTWTRTAGSYCNTTA